MCSSSSLLLSFWDLKSLDCFQKHAHLSDVFDGDVLLSSGAVASIVTRFVASEAFELGFGTRGTRFVDGLLGSGMGRKTRTLGRVFMRGLGRFLHRVFSFFMLMASTCMASGSTDGWRWLCFLWDG